MTFSLNELDGLLRKAAVGAGFPVGNAIAIATAGVWLARRRFPVCDVVARAVVEGGRDSSVVRGSDVTTFQAAWASVDGPHALDLLLAGAGDLAVVLDDVDEPLLLLGMAGVAASVSGVRIVFNCDDGECVVGDGSVIAPPRWTGAGKRQVTLRLLAGAAVGEAGERATRYDPAACRDGGWDQLAALAHKTYVPASDQSRLTGAGAGLIDND